MQAASPPLDSSAPRHDWTVEQALALFERPFSDLIFQAQRVHRAWHAPNRVQMSTLLSIKTGGCPEDCAYCPQSAYYHTGVAAEPLMPLEQVLARARAAKAAGATRFCMGAAYRAPRTRDLERIGAMITAVRALGLETCATLGMLTTEQAQQLSEAGLDYYNHNLDTSQQYYQEIISTRSYQERLDTLAAVRAAGMRVCCGGIVGLGESRRDRAELLVTLANLPQHPESVPINQLVRVPGTPLAEGTAPDPFEFVRTIAASRIMLPRATVRLSAGRSEMSDELQALAFLAGANSIFYGERLLTTGNPDVEHDRALLARLGMHAEAPAGIDAAEPTAGVAAPSLVDTLNASADVPCGAG
jgi:biotin synthase